MLVDQLERGCLLLIRQVIYDCLNDILIAQDRLFFSLMLTVACVAEHLLLAYATSTTPKTAIPIYCIGLECIKQAMLQK